MSVLRSVQSRLIQIRQIKSVSITHRSTKPRLWRRGLAELIDRILPLPFLAFIFPEWTVAVFLYHLLCDASPERRSVGKWICRLRVVSVGRGLKPSPIRAITRRVGSAATQSAFCLWQSLPVVFTFELASLVCVLLSPTGQRLEDLIAGTRVVTESTFRRMQRHKEIPE
jgi:uncharacterized RDD family membrane protein YckC